MRYRPSNPRTLLLVALLVTLLAASGATALAQTPTTPVTPPDPLAGKAIYAANCAPCHGDTGKGDGPSAAGLGVPPTAFADPAALAGKSLAELFDITRNGNMQRMMPPWKNRLNDQQIWDAVGHAWSLHTSAAQIETGAKTYETNCATCHGPAGKGIAPAPDLTDFAATSKVSQAVWTQSVANGKGTMAGFSGKLSDAEQTAALEYVRSLSFAGPMFRGPLAKGTGVISGTVTNGTTNTPLANAAVELGIFDQTSVLEQRTATTDAAGFYRFAELPTETGLVFSVRVQYPAGVPYSSDIAGFEQGKPELNLPLTVYETTTDASGIRAERVHYIIEFSAGQAFVAELMVFGLDGNRAYVGDGSGVLRLTVPPNAQGLTINGSEQAGRFTITSDGFVDTQPLTPGTGVRQLIYQYALPLSGDTLDFVRTLPYPSVAVNALVSDVGEQVTSEELVNQGVRQTQNGNYVNLVGANLSAGQQVTIRMTKLSAASATGGTATPASGGGTAADNILLWVLIVLAAAILVLLTALLLRRRAPAAAPAATFAGPTGPSDSGGLIDALARLDMAHDAGEVSEAAYQEQRLRLKAQLRAALKQEAQGKA